MKAYMWYKLRIYSHARDEGPDISGLALSDISGLSLSDGCGLKTSLRS